MDEKIKEKALEVRLALLTKAAKYIIELDCVGCPEDLDRYASILNQLAPAHGREGSYALPPLLDADGPTPKSDSIVLMLTEKDGNFATCSICKMATVIDGGTGCDEEALKKMLYGKMAIDGCDHAPHNYTPEFLAKCRVSAKEVSPPVPDSEPVRELGTVSRRTSMTQNPKIERHRCHRLNCPARTTMDTEWILAKWDPEHHGTSSGARPAPIGCLGCNCAGAPKEVQEIIKALTPAVPAIRVSMQEIVDRAPEVPAYDAFLRKTQLHKPLFLLVDKDQQDGMLQIREVVCRVWQSFCRALGLPPLTTPSGSVSVLFVDHDCRAYQWSGMSDDYQKCPGALTGQGSAAEAEVSSGRDRLTSAHILTCPARTQEDADWCLAHWQGPDHVMPVTPPIGPRPVPLGATGCICAGRRRVAAANSIAGRHDFAHLAFTEKGTKAVAELDAISISKDGGVMVGEKELSGVTRWGVSRDMGQGVTEIALVLVTPKLTVDLTAPNAWTRKGSIL